MGTGSNGTRIRAGDPGRRQNGDWLRGEGLDCIFLDLFAPVPVPLLPKRREMGDRHRRIARMRCPPRSRATEPVPVSLGPP